MDGKERRRREVKRGENSRRGKMRERIVTAVNRNRLNMFTITSANELLHFQAWLFA